MYIIYISPRVNEWGGGGGGGDEAGAQSVKLHLGAWCICMYATFKVYINALRLILSSFYVIYLGLGLRLGNI